MTGAFAGPTADSYRRFRRDLPAAVVGQLVQALSLTSGDRVLDLGAGTGQVAVPVAARVASVLAVDPESDMLAQLRGRLVEESVSNVVCVLVSDEDLSAVTDAVGPGSMSAVTVANALHHMDPVVVFAGCARLLSPTGGVAVITHGQPLWLVEADWTRALRGYLETWTGPLRSTCGSDPAALDDRRAQLARAGFSRVTVLENHYRAAVDAGYVLGHLASAMPPDLITTDRRAAFEAGLRDVLHPYEHSGGLVEDVPVTVAIGQR